MYNVEAYLRQCLDSVVNQTMRDIQIICVNDGSPDGSRAILQEYADRDSRIEIIDKTNGGLSSARNAAYPYIKGKYTLFVDSDDWIELDLCKKTYCKAEETNAPITIFFYQSEGRINKRPVWSRISSGGKNTVEEKKPLLGYYSACSKLWRTDFLLENNLYFPEGLAFEDVPIHWKAVVLTDRIVILPEPLYHYRFNADSITKSSGKHHLDIVSIYSHVFHFLKESGHYFSYKDQYHKAKLWEFFTWYKRSSVELQQEFRNLIRENLCDEDREYYRNGKVARRIARFYKMVIDGSPFEQRVYQTFAAIRRFFKSTKKAA